MRDYLYFFVGVIIPSYQLVQWLGQTFGGILKRLFVRSERDLITWVHYEKKALRDGHQAKTPAECQDERCSEV